MPKETVTCKAKRRDKRVPVFPIFDLQYKNTIALDCRYSFCHLPFGSFIIVPRHSLKIKKIFEIC